MKIAMWWNKQTFLQKFFVLFLIFSGIMWGFVPAMYYSTLPFDPPETLMWGSTFNWGSAKHPPMSGYMLFHFCKLFGFQNFSIFILSQICVTVGFIYIYKLARCFFNKDKSVIATLLITFYFFYNYETPKFNANIPHLLFLPMMSYYFYRGCYAGKWHHWLLAAASAACACLSKYSAGVVGLTFVIFIFADKDARKALLSVKPYIAALLFAGLMTPHILHLFNTDFLVFNYINHGKTAKYSYVVQFLVQLAAIAAPLLCMAAACLITRICGNSKTDWGRLKIDNLAAFRYSGCIIWGQAAFLLLMGCTGHRLLTIWTFPLYLNAGIFIMSFYHGELNIRSQRSFVWLCSVFALVVLLFSAGYHSFRSKYRYHINRDELRKAAECFYRERTGKEVPFITGDIWHASSLQNAFKYTVKAAPSDDPILLGMHWDTIRRNGALVISSEPESVAKDLAKYVNVELPWHKEEIEYAARLGKVKKYDFYLTILPADSLKELDNKK